MSKLLPRDMLNVIPFGAGNDRPLLIAHGLFGSARNWGVISKRLAETRPVLTVDMRNHANSFWADGHSYEELAEDLAQVIVAHGGQADVLGHSMGGKAAMTLALTQPELVGRLIVADIAPVAYSHTQIHLVKALQAIDPSGFSKRSEADAAVRASVPDATTRAFLLQSLDLTSGTWRLNLNALETEMDKILGFPNLTSAFAGPTFFLSGAASDYVRPEDRPKIKSLFPKARFAKIPGAGHWLHAEKPREFVAAVAAFLSA